jgi:hypothetical protein
MEGTHMIHNPGNTQPITELKAWLSRDKNGNEGILAASGPGGGAFPLVFGYSQPHMIAITEPIARKACDSADLELVLATFRRVT